jgi:nucleoside-diphosphate-sugar epimerase
MQLVKFSQLYFELDDVLAIAGPEIERMRGKSVYITGQTGFIGSWIWKTLYWVNQWQNLNIRMVRQWKDDTYHHVPGEYDIVYHCAPTDYPFDEVIAKESLLFTSSGSVPNGLTHYAQMKQGHEEEIIRRCTNARIARIYTLVGPMQRNNFAVTAFIKAAIEGTPLEVFGDGSAIRTYMYIADCVHWLLKIAIDGAPGGVYNVGATEPITIKELAYKVAGMVDPPGDVKFVKPDFVDHAPRYIPDVAKTLLLGMKPLMPIDEALARTIKFTKDCPRVI